MCELENKCFERGGLAVQHGLWPVISFFIGKASGPHTRPSLPVGSERLAQMDRSLVLS
jgi:hypothetical protein